jgi:hypothetical protein
MSSLEFRARSVLLGTERRILDPELHQTGFSHNNGNKKWASEFFKARTLAACKRNAHHTS